MSALYGYITNLNYSILASIMLAFMLHEIYGDLINEINFFCFLQKQVNALHGAACGGAFKLETLIVDYELLAFKK